jgi:hypothetical protein
VVTLKPYLDAMRKKTECADAAPPPTPPPASPWPEFTTALVDSVSRYVLDAEPYRDIREDLRLLSENLRAAEQPPLSSEEFDRSIQEFRRRSEDASKARCSDMRRMLSGMNEALIILAAGSDRSLDALRQMEMTLELAATLNDISSLKSKVNDVIRLVAHETARLRDESPSAISEMQNQITGAQKTLHTGPAEYPDREHAVTAMTEGMQRNAGGFVGVFVLQRLSAIAVRYGKDTARELLHNLVRDRIHPLAPDAQAFAWSEDTALLVVPSGTTASNLKDQIRANPEIPFEHRFVCGGRLATLKGNLHAKVLAIHPPVSQTVCDIDIVARSAAK